MHGLHGEASRNGRNETREVGGADVLWQLARSPGHHKPLSQCLFSSLAPFDHRLLNGLSIDPTSERGLDREAPARVTGLRQEKDSTVQQRCHGIAQNRFLQRIAHITHGSFSVSLHSLPEQCCLITEGGIHAGSVYAHRGCKVGQRRALVALLPKHPHCSLQRGVLIETPWAAPLR